jgi:gliding motility-associated-like protein
MKFLLIFFTLIGAFLGGDFAQAQSSNTCQTARALCDNITPYPANITGANAPSGNNYDCLGSQPDPAWFYFTIASSGSIQMSLRNSAVVDVDFILWGPFPSQAAAFAQCGNMGQGGQGSSVVDCSFDPQAFESVDIPNAVAGQVYVLMITNYSGRPTNIFTLPNTGSGSIACPCDINTDHTLTNVANNDGVLINTVDSAAQYGVCPGDSLYFTVSMRASTAFDDLSFSVQNTNINNIFPNNQYSIFGPFYPVAGRLDTMQIVVGIFPQANMAGTRSFRLGINSRNRSNGITCQEVAPITVIIPSLSANDTLACSGQQLGLNAFANPPNSPLGNPTFSWVQIGGQPVNLTQANTANPTINMPISQSTRSNNPAVLVVSSQYGACTLRDTVRVNFPDVDLILNPNPTSVCPPGGARLGARITDTLGVQSACFPDYVLGSIPYAPISGAGTNVSLNDEQMSGALPIGFNFDFYCNRYTNFYISSNGFITFSSGQPTANNNASIPTGASPNNFIALAWDDLNPRRGGTINYSTVGTAPNRQLVVRFNNVPFYAFLFPSNYVTGQIILYEGSNVIEMHIADIDNNSSGTTQGIENVGGAQGIAVNGRNNQNFSSTNEGFRFTPIPGTPIPAPPAYVWSPAGTLSNPNVGNPVASPTATTIYTVTVTDAACIYTGNVTVTTDGLGITSAPRAPFCDDLETGRIILSATGGAAPYRFLWSNGRTTQNLGNVPSGTYTVTVTDANNCVGVHTATVPPALAPNLSNTTTPSLCGVGTGSIDLNVSTGRAPFTYIWSTGANTQDINGLRGGTYSVTVTDYDGCTSTSGAILVNQQSSITVTGFNITNVVCRGDNNGAVTVNISGGNLPLTYAWSNGGNGSSITGLRAGVYNVTITDATGCTVVSPNATVTQPFGMGLTTNAYPIRCFGQTNGIIDANASGGTAPYTYLWSNGQTNTSLSGLSAGNYALTATDVNGCRITASNISIEEPLALSLSLVTSTSVSCFGQSNGTANVSVTGGNPAYTYTWSNGSSQANVSGLAVGTYTVTASDANNCTVTPLSVSISQPSALTASVLSVQNASCSGLANGSAAISVSGGSPAYVLLWSNGQTSSNLSGVLAGTYTLSITDANGCTISPIQTTISAPSAISISTVSVTNANCGIADGSADIDVNGGNPAYAYLWSNGSTNQDLNNVFTNNYTLTVTDANNCSQTANIAVNSLGTLSASVAAIVSVSCNGGNNGQIQTTPIGGTLPYTFNWSNGQTGQNASGLSTGTYVLTLTDAGACVFILNNISISQPSALSLSVDSLNPRCFGFADGEASVSVTGGNPSYTYIWSNGQSNRTATGLVQNAYNVSVTDAAGCIIVSRNIQLVQPTLIVPTISVASTVTCFGGANGTLNLNASGGEPFNFAPSGYIFKWTSTDSTPDVSLSGLTAGIYTFTVRDRAGCIVTASAVSISQPAQISLSLASSQSVTCAGYSDGGLNTNASGGVPAYSYLWSSGQTTANISASPAGVYSLTLTDANGCDMILNNLSITSPAVLIANPSPSVGILDCAPNSVGTITANPQGGTGIYTYLWAIGNSSQSIGNLSAGSYSLTVTDANGCTASGLSTLVRPVVPTLAAYIGQIGTKDTLIDLGTSTGLFSGTNLTNYVYAWAELLQPTAAGMTNPNIPQTNTNPSQAGQYVFVIRASATTNGQICTSQDTVRLTVRENIFAGIPTAFSPDGDGSNDFFRPLNLNTEFIREFKIYNRWGNLVYDSPTLSGGGWDGTFNNTEQPRDVYMFLLTYKFPQNPEPITIRGEVTLMR